MGDGSNVLVGQGVNFVDLFERAAMNLLWNFT